VPGEEVVGAEVRSVEAEGGPGRARQPRLEGRAAILVEGEGVDHVSTQIAVGEQRRDVGHGRGAVDVGVGAGGPTAVEGGIEEAEVPGAGGAEEACRSTGEGQGGVGDGGGGRDGGEIELKGTMMDVEAAPETDVDGRIAEVIAPGAVESHDPADAVAGGEQGESGGAAGWGCGCWGAGSGRGGGGGCGRWRARGRRGAGRRG